MDIKVIGMGCDNCTRMYQNTVRAMQQLGIPGEPEKVEDLVEIVKLGVLAAPGLMADGRLLMSGRVAGVPEIVKALKKVQA